MKKALLFLVGSLIAGSTQFLCAQSITFFHKENHFARSIGNVPGTPDRYITAETIDGPSDQAIHVSYFQDPNTLVYSFLLDQPGVDDQSVAVVPLSPNTCMIAANSRDLSSGTVRTRLILVDPTNGSILQSQLFNSKDPSYNSMYALDAKYDANLHQFVVCGMLFRKLDDAPADKKAAFVLTTDLNFNGLNMQSYESVAPGQTDDYDIANRVVITNSGQYYISGSENAQKWVGNYTHQSIRNMLIDPNTLSPIWRVPFGLATDLHEMSLDMIEDPYGLFAAIVNYDQAKSWGILRIDPGSGISPTGFLETTGWPEYANNVTSSSLGSNFAAVTGMQWQTVNPCNTFHPQEADPFFTLLDLNSIPASVVNRTEYQTAIGNNNGSIDYWTYGGFYAPQNGYPLSPYCNKMSDRSAGNMHQTLAPILNASTNWLNTKFISTDEYGNTNCPVYNCTQPLNQLTANPAQANLWDYHIPISQQLIDVTSIPYDPYGSDECSNGYYRGNPASASTTAAQQAVALKIYPNPTAEVLNVQLPGDLNGPVRVDLTDISGQRVASVYDGPATASPIVYQLPAHLPGGMYLVQINAPGKQPIQEKLTVIR